ncbi:MAG TPA: outer membrane protein assembly factor BamE [Luteibacter sp.]|jgi:outer membrane protein assembly factor BamE (lipoprotein component of BamABCDE complex)|uniref:outer membrane protein assembly factor BamE domain-containing protein n=1 Tax=Luteibacter sp. TaxID=1886636 RepID=UPI002F3F29CB
MRARLSSLLISALLTLTLAGCATTTGRPFNTEAASQFSDGKTTQAQVRSALGEPETVQDRGDGTTMWVYSSSESKASVRDYIPFAGVANNTRMQALTLVFDRRGVLESHTAMQSR